MSDVMLEARGVVKGFGRKTVLKGVELSVAKGTVLGLVGKNGAGKTTLLQCALGLLRTDAGQLEVVGEPSGQLSARARNAIGYAPQVPYLPSWMTVQQILNYTGTFQLRWNQALITRLLREWEVDPGARVGTLSQGEAQKVSILCALGHEPELLILDEPAVGLDPGARRGFLSTLLSIVSGGERTVVLSSHFTPDLERVADRLAVLKDGKIWYEGPQDELKEQVVRFHVVGKAPLPTDLVLPGTLRLAVNGCEASGAARWTPEMIREVGERLSAPIQVQSLNLEEIFMEVHHG